MQPRARAIAGLFSVATLSIFACGDDGGAANRDAPDATDDAGPRVDEDASAVLSSLPGLDVTTVSLPDVADDTPCTPATGTATISRVAFAQTHLMTPDWPFFYLTAGRPALVLVDVVGSGTSPSVSLEAKVGTTSLGTKCLKGPASLPGALDPNAPDRANSFSMTLPSAWLVPGVSFSITAGSAAKTLGPSELKIGPSPVGTLLTANFVFFGDKGAHDRTGLAREYLSKTPLARLNDAHLPIDLVFPTKFIVAPDTRYGTDAAGNPGTSPAQWATRSGSCTAAEKAAKTCTGYGAFAFIEAVRNLMGEIQKANGLGQLGFAYGDISPKAGCEGTGLGGGRLGAGGNYGLVFNHEMGHGFDFPHWADVTPPRAKSASNTYPYQGDYLDTGGLPNGGGFGRTWGYDPLDGTLVSPLCSKNGKELHDPMQRHGECANQASLKAGQKFDFYSDFTAFRFYRYFAGGAAMMGNVPYHGGTAPFGIEERDSFAEWSDPTKPDVRKWSRTNEAYAPMTDPGYYAYPTAVDRPVYLVYGTFHHPSDVLSTIYPTVLYRGNLVRQYDPTSPADFEELKSKALAYSGRDLTLRAEYEDGTVRHVLLDVSVRGDKIDDPKSGESLKYFAANLPADKRLKKVTLLFKLLATRPKGAPTIEGDVSADAAITPANVLAGAREAASYTLP